MNSYAKTIRSIGFSAIALGLMAACGGGGGTDPDPSPSTFPTFRDTDSQETSDLAAASLNSAARSTAGLSGTLNRGADRATIGNLSGDINADRSEVELSGGGTLKLQWEDNEYSSRYVAEGQGFDRTIGIIGAVTSSADLPTSNATYNGTTTLTIQDGGSLFDVSGSAEIVADFGSGDVTTTLDDLDGTRVNGLNLSNVSNVATITITDSDISGATFDGGDVSITSSQLSNLGSSADSSLDGAFFGPEGEEVGGVLVVDDTDSGDLVIFGDFIAN